MHRIAQTGEAALRLITIGRSDQPALCGGWRRQSAERSGQGKGQETGAQQHEACRGEREESAGNCILVAHETPATSDAGPN